MCAHKKQVSGNCSFSTKFGFKTIITGSTRNGWCLSDGKEGRDPAPQSKHVIKKRVAKVVIHNI